MQVFSVTASFSILAYLWLLIILVGISQDIVEIWEAAVTLALFPTLVIIAWLVEKNICGVPSKVEASKQIELGNFQPGESKCLNVFFSKGGGQPTLWFTFNALLTGYYYYYYSSPQLHMMDVLPLLLIYYFVIVNFVVAAGPHLCMYIYT